MMEGMHGGGIRTAFSVLCLLILGAAPRSTEIRGPKHPALSPDGKQIAFDWHGDLWVCPVEGGEALRVTDDPADEEKPAWSPDGKKLAFSSDRTGNRDLFVMDLGTREVRQLTFHSADDDAPAWSPDGRFIAFQSTRDSNLDLALNNTVWDLWKMPAEGGTATRITRFRGENPSWSADGKWIAFDRYSSGYGDGEHNIFIIASDGSGLPTELASGAEDSRHPTFAGTSLYFAHEANGIASSSFRNVWKTALGGGPLFQVTGHRGGQVRWPSTSPRSTLLVYEFNFDLYTIDLRDPAPSPRKLTITTQTAYLDPRVPRTWTSGFHHPAWSPSGAGVAFACKGDLWVASVEGGKARAVTEGLEEDHDPSWSPDGKRLIYVSEESGCPGHVYTVDLEGGDRRRLTPEPGNYRSPRLSPDGRQAVVTRLREGESDLLFLEVGKPAARVFQTERSVEFADAAYSPDGKTLAFLKTQSGRSEVVLQPLGEGEPRTPKTENSRKQGLAWSPDGTKLAYGLWTANGTWHVQVLTLQTGEERSLGPGTQQPSWSPDSSMVMCEVEPRRSGPDVESLSIFDTRSAQTMALAVTVVRPQTRREEMTALFLQVYGSYLGSYYDPFYHGQDMPALRDRYLPLAAACQTKPELYELANDFIKELRSSHVHLTPAPVKNSALTGSLACDLAREDDGTLEVRHVEPGGPAEKAGIRVGERLTGVGGAPLGPDSDLDRLLTFPAASGLQAIRLTVRDESGTEREVGPVKGLDRSSLRELKYENTIARRKKWVSERTKGRLAYFHLKMMTQSEVLRLKQALEVEYADQEGLVLDERDGVGGLAHRPICGLLDSTAPERLNKAPACWMRNRNGTATPDRYGLGPGGGRPEGRSWDKPVILVQNSISRSDKEILPYTFRHLGIGYLVGMPTAGGVIGGSDWTMQDGSRITVSTQGWFTSDGRNMEGWGVPPDYRVPETHEDLYAGRDLQLEKAVEVLLAQMEGKILPPPKPGLEKRLEGAPGK
jgi:Tol biopolymer transport system component/C-terminal processing protease CtpA/Prc